MSRYSIGRLVDEVEQPVLPRPRFAPLDVPAPALGRDVPISSLSSLLVISPQAHDLISPPASEAPSSLATQQDLIPDLSVAPVPDEVQSTLSEVEDFRRYNFDSVPPLRTRSGFNVRLRTAAPTNGAVALPHGVAVEAKDDVILCIRRKSRRGVILALGQGGGFHKPPRRSPTSNIWC